MASRLKIVVADDERDSREYLHEYLSYLGHEVCSAADGQELVEVCRRFLPDLVVTDYAMPGLDGLAAAAAINREWPVPVIVVTGRHNVDALLGDERYPVVMVLAKPVKEAILQTAVESVTAQLACGILARRSPSP